MTIPRAGVQAGINLSSLNDVRIWERVEGHFPLVLEADAKSKKEERDIRVHEAALQILASQVSDKESFSKDELLQIVDWKHAVGKNRTFNTNLVKTNAREAVVTHTRAAVALARAVPQLESCVNPGGSLSMYAGPAIQAAIAKLEKPLRGVGPATASAVLTLVRPDVFCFMYDEVIDCFEPKRDYKIDVYLRINARCMQLARTLGEGWTASRVAKAIWTAARYLALHGDDLTESDEAAASGSEAAESNKRAAIGDEHSIDSSNGGSTDDKKKAAVVKKQKTKK